jgi:PAS domain S-box-containing protein
MMPTPAINFKLLFEQLPGLFLILTPDFKIVMVSDLYIEASLTTRESIIGHNIFEAFPDNPDDHTANGVSNLRASLNYVLQHKQLHAMADQKYDIRRPDGVFEERYWSPQNTPVFNEQHEVCYIIHKVQDVTVSRTAANQLKNNKRNFQLLVNSVKDYAIFMLDKTGCVASWNSGAEYIKGYNTAEIIGKPMNIFYTEEDIIKGIPQYNLQKTLQNGNLETEGWRKRKDGSSFYANIVFTSLIDGSGNHYGYAKVTKDITQKRKDDDRIRLLASITENIQDPVICSDNNFRITRWNDAAEKLFGWNSNEVMGKTTVEIFNTNYLYHPREQVLAAIDENGIWRGELIYHTKSDSPVNVIATASKLKDAAGNQSGNLILIRDITARKKAEEALNILNNELECKVAERTEAIKRSEKQYRNLFENNPVPMWVMDLASFKFLDVNEMAVLQYGYSRKEFLSMTALDIRPEAEKNKFLQSDHTDKITTTNYNKGTWNHKKKDGSIIQVEIVVHDIIFHGELARIVLANDVTERIEAEEKLISSEKRFRALIENSDDLIVLLDDAYRIVYRSPSATRVTGWEDEEITGFSVAKNMHPDDVEKAAALLQEVKDNPGKPIHGKFRNKHKNGHYQWMEGIVINLLHDENVKAIVFNSRDISVRVENEEKLIASEKRYRNALDNMLEGIHIIGFDWRYIYVNDAMERHAKYSREELIGFTLMEKYPGIENTEIYKTYQKCLVDKVPVHLENEFEFPDKTKGWFELSFQPVPEGLFILSVDITDKKKAEQKIVESKENLKAIFENASEGFILTDTAGKIIIFNNKVMDSILLNTNKEIKTGSSIFDFIEGARKDAFSQVFLKVMKGETITYDRCYTSNSSKTTWINFTFNPVKADNCINGICITGRDITAQKIAEQQREFSRSNLNALINNTTDMMWSVDRQFSIITSNQAFDNMIAMLTGNKPLPGFKILDKSFPDAQIERYRTYYERAFAGEAFKEIEQTNKPYELITEISFYPIYGGSDVVGTACFSRDITKRKKAEEELKKSYTEKKVLAKRMLSIINTLPANIALLNKDGVIIEVNDAWRNFARDNKYNGAGLGLGCNYLQVSQIAAEAGDTDGAKVAEGIKAVLKNKVKEFVFEYACNSPKTERWFRMIVTPLRQKAYAGAVVMHINISELRRLEQLRLKSGMEEQKKITLAIIEGQEKERNYIGRELHDNINQILAASKIFISSACRKNEELKPLVQYPLELIDGAIEEIRLLSHNLVSPVKQADLKELCKGLLEDCKKHQVISTKFSYKVSEELLNDDLKLNIYRLLQELMNNMQKHAAAKSVRLSVKATSKLLTIIITDDGKGFDMHIKREGIGISNMINRIESFEGNMQIISSPGKGCKTLITIPI